MAKKRLTPGTIIRKLREAEVLQGLAVAAIDEIENRQFGGRRFTVGY